MTPGQLADLREWVERVAQSAAADAIYDHVNTTALEDFDRLYAEREAARQREHTARVRFFAHFPAPVAA